MRAKLCCARPDAECTGCKANDRGWHGLISPSDCRQAGRSVSRANTHQWFRWVVCSDDLSAYFWDDCRLRYSLVLVAIKRREILCAKEDLSLCVALGINSRISRPRCRHCVGREMGDTTALTWLQPHWFHIIAICLCSYIHCVLPLTFVFLYDYFYYYIVYLFIAIYIFICKIKMLCWFYLILVIICYWFLIKRFFPFHKLKKSVLNIDVSFFV